MPTPPRVAVIAVHGVADQAPHASARQIANLLANLDDNGSACYAPFAEETVRVPVRPLRVPPCATLYEMAGEGSRHPEPIEHRFMEGLLTGFRGDGPDATYETVRLRGSRNARGEPIGVDVYEMYWADLSRLGTTTLRMLGELYQLVLHAGSLAKHAASASTAGNRSLPARLFRDATALASWTLAGPIAVLNAYFLVSAALVLSSLVPASWHLFLSIAVVTVATIVAIGAALLRSAQVRLAYRLGAALVPAAVASALIYLAYSGRLEVNFEPVRLFGAEVLLGSLAGTSLLLSAYRRRRPHIEWIAIPGGILVLIVAAVALGGVPETALAHTGFRVTEALYLVLRYWWVAFLLLLWVSMASGAVYWRRADAARHAPARRAVRTARIMLVLPALAFLLVTVALWSAINVSLDEPFKQATYHVTPYLERFLRDVSTGEEFVDAVLVSSLGATFLVAAAVMAPALLLTAWALGPIVWTEVRPPRTNRRAGQFGAWLNTAFPTLRWAGRFVIVGFAIVWPVSLGVAPLLPVDPTLLLGGREAVAQFIRILGLSIAVPAAGLLAFHGRLQSLAVGFRAPLDVLLDVDSYLREHPRDSAPRARLCARYASLLAHVGALPYDAVVIVAHSQGSVLTADLLRYAVSRHIDLGLPRVYVFTMGSPLRQLYAERFPDLYAWAWHDAPAAARQDLPDIDPGRPPRPAELRVKRWVNAYRSGDYIGRWLWRPDNCGYQFDVAREGREPWQSAERSPEGHSHDAAGTRREFCIGAGAHTHYWDATAPAVAVELDRLVREAAAGA